MADWTAFGAVAGLVLLLVLGLARATTAAMTGDGRSAASAAPERAVRDEQPGDERPRSGARVDAAPSPGPSDETASGDDRDDDPSGDPREGPADEPTGEPAAESTDESAADPVDRRDGESASAPDVESAGASDVESAGTPDVDAAARSTDEADQSDGGERSVRANGGEASARAFAEQAAPASDEPLVPSVSAPWLLANVVVTHGVLAIVLVGAAAMTGVPFSALGVASDPWSTGLPALAGGVALGLVLAAANAVLAASLDRFGVEYSEALRSALAPDSAFGWVLLLGVTLPLVAIFEELLFRAVLVGALAAGSGLPPWLFVVPSSLAFAAGHGLQGRGGVLVTGGLGAVLAGAFVLTNSLLLVVVAHYVVNAVEFVVHEGFGVELRERLSV